MPPNTAGMRRCQEACAHAVEHAYDAVGLWVAGPAALGVRWGGRTTAAAHDATTQNSRGSAPPHLASHRVQCVSLRMSLSVQHRASAPTSVSGASTTLSFSAELARSVPSRMGGSRGAAPRQPPPPSHIHRSGSAGWRFDEWQPLCAEPPLVSFGLGSNRRRPEVTVPDGGAEPPHRAQYTTVTALPN